MNITFNENFIPQMMPIKWLIIFIFCIFNLINLMLYLNFMLIKLNFYKKKLLKKKWKFIW